MSENYASKADLARAALKAAGYSARQVTCRMGYRDANVTIRDAAVRAAVIDEILSNAIKPERVYCDGDEFSAKGYDVSYERGIVERFSAAVEVRIRGGAPRAVTFAAPGVRVYIDPDSSSREEVHHLDGDIYRTAWDIPSAASQVARMMLDRGYGSPVPADWIDRLDLDDAAPDRPALAIVR